MTRYPSSQRPKVVFPGAPPILAYTLAVKPTAQNAPRHNGDRSFVPIRTANPLARPTVARLLHTATSRMRVFTVLAFAAAALNLSAQLIYSDSFDYSNGLLVGAAGSPWVQNYSSPAQARVIDGRLFLSQNLDECVRVDFPTNYTTGSVYVRFRATFTSLPTFTGNYIGCLRQWGVDNNRGRIHVTTNGAAPGKFRLGVSTFSNSGSLIPEDLSLGVTYSVVLRYDITNFTSTLWLNPTSESDTQHRSDNAYEGTLTKTAAHFVFVETDTLYSPGGMGDLYVDDLRIGRTFNDVWDGPWLSSATGSVNGSIALQGVGLPGSNYVFQATANLVSPQWVNLSTNAASASGAVQYTDTAAPNFSSRFYRLQSL